MLLEVIVQTLADARAAQEGGADRLEVVEDIDRGGLTPSVDLVRAIAAETGLALRVMVREHDGFTVDGAGEMGRLRRAVEAFAALGVDGVVLGFARHGELDLESTRQVLSAAPVRATFHRAFDTLADPRASIAMLRELPQIDRLLTNGGGGTVQARCARWCEYAARAGTRPIILAGGGLDDEAIAAVASARSVLEIHVGRAARHPPLATAPVSAARVRRLREIVSPQAG
jgi:copper homeostasis protein